MRGECVRGYASGLRTTSEHELRLRECQLSTVQLKWLRGAGRPLRAISRHLPAGPGTLK